MQGIIVGDVIPKEKLEQLKKGLVESAVKDFLVPRKDYGTLDDMQVDFGFFYMLEEHVVAMFKIVTDKDIIYFGQQMGTLSRLPGENGEKHYEQLVGMMQGVNGRYLKIG